MSKDRDPLQPLLSDIQAKLGRMREDLKTIRGSIQKVRKILENGFKDLHEAIYDSIEAQAELKLMERLAEVRSIPPQIEAEQKRISGERSEIENSIDSVSDRYEQKHAELNQKASNRVRNLGEHIFAILEEEFEDGIETPFVDALTPTWEEFKEHNAGVVGDRNDQLWTEYNRADENIDEFLNHREQLLADISRHRVDDSLSIDEPTVLQIPFWVVTIERDGSEESVVVTPSHIRDDKDGWFTAHVSPIEGFDSHADRLAESKPGYRRTPNTTPAELGSAIQDHASTKLGGVLSFDTEFRRAVNGIEIEIEDEEGTHARH